METTAASAMEEDESMFIYYPKTAKRYIKDTIYDQSRLS
jgi:hypothetical protein